MNIYIISDTHFFHYNIIGYCGRPFKSEKEMNTTMIKRWNSTVKEEDLVIHVGDVILSNKTKYFAELIQKLNGRKILVRGNHDRKSIHWYLTHGFDFVCDKFTIGHIIFTHRPIKKQDFLLMPYKLNIHGHIHEKETFDKDIYFNASVEQTNYLPIKIDKILGKFGLKLKRKIKQGD